MDYKTNIEFLDWLMWDKEANEKEWLEASEEAKDAMFKEFEETRRKKKMNEIKFIPIYKGKFNKVAKPSIIKRFLKAFPFRLIQ